MKQSKYNDNFPLLAEGMARQGLTNEQIAANLGIGKNTFYQYLKRYQDFSDSLKRGKAPVDFKVENSLLKRCLGYEYAEVVTDTDKDGKIKGTKTSIKMVIPDVTAQIFWLKNRRPDLWKDRTDANHTVTDKTELEAQKALFDSMTYEEKAKWLENNLKLDQDDLQA